MFDYILLRHQCVPNCERLYVNLLTSTSHSFYRWDPPRPPCPLVCLASGSNTQNPHCVAVLRRGRGKRAYISSLLSSAALFSSHTKKQLLGMTQLKSKTNAFIMELAVICFFPTNAYVVIDSSEVFIHCCFSHNTALNYKMCLSYWNLSHFLIPVS